MGLWDGIKRFFGGGKALLPEDPQDQDPGPLNMRESEIMLDRLQESNTRNEVMLRQIRHEVEQLERRQLALEEQIRALPPDSFKVRMMIQELDQLQSEKEAKVRKADIYSGNLKRNKAAIQSLEINRATGERGVSADDYARIMLDQREQLEAWRAEQIGDVRGEKGEDLIAERDRQRLAELERKVLGSNTHFGNANRQPQKREAPPTDEEIERMAQEAEAEMKSRLASEEAADGATRRKTEPETGA